MKLHDWANRVRERWIDLSEWGRPRIGEPKQVSLGRVPIRPAIIDPASTVVAESSRTQGEARDALTELVEPWPGCGRRLAIEGGTGLGKSTAAVRRAVAHLAGETDVDGALLYVAHDNDQMRVIKARILEECTVRGLPLSGLADLRGRQSLDPDEEDWGDVTFGCMAKPAVNDAARRYRSIHRDVCQHCRFRGACSEQGYLAHDARAMQARVIVTNVQRFRALPDKAWDRIGAVILDEDVLPSLLTHFTVVHGDLTRARAYIRTQAEALPSRDGGSTSWGERRAEDLAQALPLLDELIDLLEDPADRNDEPVINHLSEWWDICSTSEGPRFLRRLMPRRWVKHVGGKRRPVPDARSPAEWEEPSGGTLPRQVWGDFMASLAAEWQTAGTSVAGTVRLQAGKGARARIRIDRLDIRTLRHLRRRPVLLLDATLHPFASSMMDCEHHLLAYQQGRHLLQVLMPLAGPEAMLEYREDRPGPSDFARRLVSQVAFLVAGCRGYVLCRKGVVRLLRKEASRYYELRRTEFITHKRERGWNADTRATVFVVLGRYAKNGTACLREARAIRAAAQTLNIEIDWDAMVQDRGDLAVFYGRNKPATYRGEPIVRDMKGPPDSLARMLQDYDLAASARQFVGRDRTRQAFVLLMRGDPTIPTDAFIELRDIPCARPASTSREPAAIDPSCPELFHEESPWFETTARGNPNAL